MFDKLFRSRAVVQRHLSSPLLQGNESESHRTLRTQTNKSSEALVRRQGTPDLLTEYQLCGVRARESVPATMLSGRTPHNGDRHKTAPCDASIWIARCSGRLRISKTSCSISGDTSTVIARMPRWGDEPRRAHIATSGQSLLLPMATSLSRPLSHPMAA
jgi:hypothetical protein